MAYLTKDQVVKILKEAPKGTDPAGIVAALRAQGHELEGYDMVTKQLEQVKPTPPVEEKKGLIDKIGSDLTRRVGNVQESIGMSQSGKQTTAETVIQGAGQVAGFGGDLVGRALGSLANAAGLKLNMEHPAVQAGLQALEQGAEAYNTWRQNNLREAKNLEAVVNIASILPAAKAAQVGTKGAVGAAKTAKNIAQDIPLTMLKRNPVKAGEAVTRAAGTITQGKTADIAPAKRALSTIDVKNIKTYKDLGTALDNHIAQLSEKLDTALSTKKGALTLDKLSTALKVGEQSVSHNYVEDALSQLKNFYKKTNDVASEAKISQIEAKAKSQGLTVKEVNDLAKLHGQDLNGFNANGELASGLTKQAAENTRSGLKGTARNIFGNKVYKNADSRLSDLIKTRDLVSNVEEKVNALKQKILKRGLGATIGYKVGKAINALGLGSPKGMIDAFVTRGQGFKVMNALDLEKNLQKNLNKLQKLSDLPDDKLLKQLEVFVKQAEKATANRPSAKVKD